MFYQISDINNNVLEVLENITYIKQDKYFRYFVTCGEPDAQGIVGQDRNTVYQLRKRNAIYIDTPLQVVDLSKIDEKTYLKLKKELNNNN